VSQYGNTEYPGLNDDILKYCITEMKPDIKL